jgi:signal peptidase I
VVFRPPPVLLAAGYDPRAALIKRVVAGPGDRIEVRDGILWRNGTAFAQDWRREPMTYTLPAFTVPVGHLMVLGDNRNASLDSHVWGPLPLERVVGTAVWRYWPLSRFGPIRTSSSQRVGSPGELG